MTAGLNRIEAALRAPLHAVDLAGLLELWQHDDAVVVCARPADLEDCPDLPLRIRGALGNILEMMDKSLLAYPGSDRVDPFDRPTAHRLLFGWTPPKRDGGEVAKPYVVRADVRGNLVEARVRLFGMAAFQGPAVLRALAAAMAGGVSVRNHGTRAVFPVRAARLERFDGAMRVWPASGSAATIDLLTPVIIRKRQVIRIDPLSLMRSALRRASALAPWMHCALVHDVAALERLADTFRYKLDIHAEQWTRTSRNAPGIAIPMAGYGGRLRISGSLGDWAAYLDLAQYASLGGECALGFGAVRSALYP